VTVIEKEMQSRPAVEEYWVPLLLDSNEVEGQFRGQQIVIYNTSTQDKLHMIYYIAQLLVYIIFFIFLFYRKASAFRFDEKNHRWN
jgi:hypothetical protein